MEEIQPQHITKELISRKLWVFTCAGCNKKRRVTFSRGKATSGLCRICRTEALERRRNENQLGLFDNPLMISDSKNIEKWNPEPDLAEV